MGHGGLVAYVEAQIERDIALGRLPPSGQFGSEAKLARRYDVCRGTLREALRRLAARGLVVQRPGRKTRAVPLDESLTLENLGLALHDARSPEARWLLEGYFSLRRQVLVELLSDCCTRASEWDLKQLAGACFGLWDAARWEDGAYCARMEFELLRMAARAAGRPGHVLLVQSLQRAFMGGAAQLLPLLGGEATRQWATCAEHALHERDAQTIQHELPVLLKACDDHVLDAFAPQKPATLDGPSAQECRLTAPGSAISEDEVLMAHPAMEGHGVGFSAPANRQDEAQGALPVVEGHGVSPPVPAIQQDESLETGPAIEAHACDASGAVAPHARDLESHAHLEVRGPGGLSPGGEDTTMLEEAHPMVDGLLGALGLRA